MRSLCILAVMAATVAAQSQVEPKGGTWKTWVLASGSQVRLAPPPDAASTKSELAWIKTFQAGLDSDGKGQIAYWDQGPASYHWVQWLQHRLSDQMNAGTVSNPSALRQLALLNVAVYDAMVAAWDSKYFYNGRNRPRWTAHFTLCSRDLTCLPTRMSSRWPPERQPRF